MCKKQIVLPAEHKKRAVLFDMDGTLLDTLEDLQDAVNHVLAAHGYPERSLEQIRAAIGNGAGMLLRRSLPEGVGEAEFSALLEEYRAWYEAHNCVKTHPYPGVAALLDVLQEAGYAVGIVSNKPDGAAKLLAARFFPGVPAFGQVPELPVKPAPELIQKALAELGCDRSRAVYVGDSEVDVQTGKNAGLPVYSVCWGFRSRETLAQQGAAHLVADCGALAACFGVTI